MNKEQQVIAETEKRHQIVGDTIEKIAHQWRQPLNTVSLLMQELYFKINLGTLYSGQENEEQLKEVFAEQYNDLYDKVNLHLQYLSETVDDFRKAVVFNGNKERKYFSIKNFIEELSGFVETSLEHEKIKLTTLTDIKSMKIVEVNGVENDLKQVVLNIIHNSQDIFRERELKNRKIEISTRLSNSNKIVLAIRDNAGGIPEDILDKVFDPYFTTRHETRGTGLGLYMSREMILKSFGGNIRAENSNNCSKSENSCGDGFGKGACFIIEIPEFREI
ncbi:signal transduction histidine kinase [Thiovulum sp. ES]|nr:signal transduction histidine kinase [Thiovulum sp. ES]